MPVRNGVVNSAGANIHYLDWGGSGQPLILIHATGFLAALWHPIAEQLSKRFRVIAIDQRGHGDSDKPTSGYRFENFVGDLQRLIDALELEHPLAAGHSSGATTIVLHAAKHPGVIQRAVLIEAILPRPDWFSAPSSERPNPNAMAEAARKRRAVWPSTQALFDSYWSRPPFETWQEDVLRRYVEEGTQGRDDGQIELKCPPQIEAQFFDAVRYLHGWEALERMECQTLLLWGAESHLRTHGLDNGGQEAFPHGQAVVVPNATHFLPQEQPDEVARLMEQFLTTNGDPS